jgi:hypothetical protein
MRPVRGLAPLLLGAVATACGSPTSATGATCRPTPTVRVAPPQATAGILSVSADRAIVNAGDTVSLVAHLAGPARLQTDCSAPVQLVVIDRADVHVAAESPPGVHGVPCGDVRLAAGSGIDYELTWTPDPTLPSGPYTAVVTVGDLPGLMLTLVLGPRQGETEAC